MDIRSFFAPKGGAKPKKAEPKEEPKKKKESPSKKDKSKDKDKAKSKDKAKAKDKDKSKDKAKSKDKKKKSKKKAEADGDVVMVDDGDDDFDEKGDAKLAQVRSATTSRKRTREESELETGDSSPAAKDTPSTTTTTATTTSTTATTKSEAKSTTPTKKTDSDEKAEPPAKRRRLEEPTKTEPTSALPSKPVLDSDSPTATAASTPKKEGGASVKSESKTVGDVEMTDARGSTPPLSLEEAGASSTAATSIATTIGDDDESLPPTRTQSLSSPNSTLSSPGLDASFSRFSFSSNDSIASIPSVIGVDDSMLARTPKSSVLSPGSEKASPAGADSPMDEPSEPFVVQEIDPEEISTISGLRAYKQRSAAPLASGAVPIPKGRPNCLGGWTFLVTGTLPTLERDEVPAIVEQYGGAMAKSVTKKLNFLIVGSDAGESKVRKARAQSKVTKLISEEGFFHMLRNAPTRRGVGSVIKKSRKSVPKAAKVTPHPDSVPKRSSESVKSPVSSVGGGGGGGSTSASASASKPASAGGAGPSTQTTPQETQVWADKYRPNSSADLIGNANKINMLREWLANWNRYHLKGDKAPVRGIKNKGFNLAFKAALLSGPPGLGKTSTAHIIAREVGYEPVEFNASDTRSKKNMQEYVADMLGNRSMDEFFFKDKKGKAPAKKKKVVLLMDEVDGMSSGDRGGMAELIKIIKTTKVPVICMCNDRQHRAVRSLQPHCLDLPFGRPTALQVAPRILGIARNEGLAIDNSVVEAIVTNSNGDLRQIVNMLQMWRRTTNKVTGAQAQQQSLQAAKTVMALSPFRLIENYLVAERRNAASLNTQLDWYYAESALMPLFVQESYLSTHPAMAPRGGHPKDNRALLDIVRNAADSIADADILDRAIHQDQNWALMPAHGVMSCVRPAFFVHGRMIDRINFPGWLGKNSSRNKNNRLMGELSAHMRMSVSGSARELCMQMLPTLARKATKPLQEGNIEEAISVLSDYHITRADFDSLLDLVSFGPKKDDPMKSLDRKAKSAFTRTYNQSIGPLPFATEGMAVKKPGKNSKGKGSKKRGKKEVLMDSDDEDDKPDATTEAEEAEAAVMEAE